MSDVIGYKLFRKRKDGTLGPLFINARQRVTVGEWLPAETGHHKKGFAYRPGWHILSEQNAPHLTETGRVWARVEIKDFEVFRRPESQGGVWYLAKYMKVLEEVT